MTTESSLQPGRSHRPQIHFYSRKRLERWPDIDTLGPADIADEQKRMRGGIDVWVVQTYLQIASTLRERGFAVTIGNQIPDKAILFAHRDDLNRFFQGLHRSFIVGVRADRSPVAVTDIEILQNGLHIKRENQFFVPSWSQPGLIPRNTSRGNRIERLAYFGKTTLLPKWFSDPVFLAALAERGIELEIRVDEWHDYSAVDLVVAHRSEAPTMLEQKPATKLYNAWLAGAPALLAPEPAYSELRQSEYDYLEIDTAADVIAAIDRLRSETGLYEKMRHQAEIRAPAFRDDAIRARWIELFDRDISDAYRRWLENRSAILAWPSFARKLLQQKLLARRFRKAVNSELAV